MRDGHQRWQLERLARTSDTYWRWSAPTVQEREVVRQAGRDPQLRRKEWAEDMATTSQREQGLTMEMLMPRVEKGAAWLDANRPGWFDLVNLATLNIESVCGDCLVCQVTGEASFCAALLEFGKDADENPSAYGWAAKHAEDAPAFWRTLRDCWVTVILERRFTDQQSIPQPDLVSVEV